MVVMLMERTIAFALAQMHTRNLGLRLAKEGLVSPITHALYNHVFTPNSGRVALLGPHLRQFASLRRRCFSLVRAALWVTRRSAPVVY